MYTLSMNFIKKGFGKVALIALALGFPIISFADLTNTPCSSSDAGKISNPISACSIPALIQTVLIGLIKISIPVIAVAIIYCGFLFVAARGNPEKISKAKGALLYTLIGAAVLLGSWAIATLISSTILGL